MLLVKVGGRVVTLAEWVLAQSGKVPSWKMVCAQVFMARLSSRTPMRFIRRPVRTCSGNRVSRTTAQALRSRWETGAQPTAGSTQLALPIAGSAQLALHTGLAHSWQCTADLAHSWQCTAVSRPTAGSAQLPLAIAGSARLALHNWLSPQLAMYSWLSP